MANVDGDDDDNDNDSEGDEAIHKTTKIEWNHSKLTAGLKDAKFR